MLNEDVVVSLVMDGMVPFPPEPSLSLVWWQAALPIVNLGSIYERCCLSFMTTTVPMTTRPKMELTTPATCLTSPIYRTMLGLYERPSWVRSLAVKVKIQTILFRRRGKR